MTQPFRRDVTAGRETFWGQQVLLLLLLASLLGLRAMSFFVGPLVPANTSRQLDWKPGVASHKARSPSEAIGGIPYVKKYPPSIPLDINKATQQELTHLPGIGPVLAERIVRYRGERGGFTEISEIQEVSGIGEKRYERLKPWIQVRGKER